MCAIVAHILHFSLSEILELDTDELNAWYHEAMWIGEHLSPRGIA
jgi:hypothetical protein